MSEPTALQRAVDAVTYTARELASSAGVSDRLLRMIRAGDRRLTPDVRDALARALRDRADRCREAAEALEAADTEPRS